jgi:phosphoglycerol transferase MdoB-like AlkP superfamily enzyme
MIDLTLKSNKRLFFSHFTSSTHHPWATPEAFKRYDYFGKGGSGTKKGKDHDDMNNYLNAVRFVDDWVGQMMELIEDAGIANQTLTVFVGDQ